MWRQILFIIGGFILLIIVVIVVYNVTRPLFIGQTQQPPTSEATEENNNLTDIAVIIDSPRTFTNLTVEVDGVVTQWIDKRTFRLGQSSGIIRSADVLVISKEEFKLPRSSGENELPLGKFLPVKVIGEVQLFDYRRIENELGIDLYDEDFQFMENDAVIIANTVETL